MFRTVGQLVVRWWAAILIVWVAVLVVASAAAPPLEDVVQSGEFAFLPPDSPSRIAEEIFAKAFPDDLLASGLAIIVRRTSHHDGLQSHDFEFIDQVLVPALDEIADLDNDERAGIGEVISRIRTHKDKSIGKILISDDKEATLVLVEFTTEFLDHRNEPTIQAIEALIAPDGPLRTSSMFPAGVDLALSGSAIVGRDMMLAAAQSADATELWTVLLVIILLIVIYRAPVLALIPLTTVYVSVRLAMSLLCIMAQYDLIGLFSGTQVYVTVIVYGAGVDYCLFLIARYKEEIDHGLSLREGVEGALAKVGAALTASAGTVICGIGMMIFAEFGKFREAGIAISFSLIVVLFAAMTFTPALLMVFRRWAFWPQIRSERLSATAGWLTAATPLARLLAPGLAAKGWNFVAETIRRYPGRVWAASILAMAPFAIIGFTFYSYLSYGLLSELPKTAPSVVGTKAVQDHFPAGITGPVTVLVEDRDINFASLDGQRLIETLTDNLRGHGQELNIIDVRSVSHPLGGGESLASPLKTPEGASVLDAMKLRAERKVARDRAVEYYVCQTGDLANHVARIDVVFEQDPFSRGTIHNLQGLEESFPKLLPPELELTTQFHYVGPTASIRDLKRVTDSDQIRIEILVLAGVYLILVALLRRPAISAYLIVSVFFSFLATLGVTFVVFWAIDPRDFSGLDWKVPMFLFTILIAVGEDYNIFLMTRIDEEQDQHGSIEGVTVALRRTGSIISSCGIIMAGTFSSLMAGSLAGMRQLGFALAFGVLLDTFVVRPILVPSYLILLHSGWFGRFGWLLGAHPPASPKEDREESSS